MLSFSGLVPPCTAMFSDSEIEQKESTEDNSSSLPSTLEITARIHLRIIKESVKSLFTSWSGLEPRNRSAQFATIPT